MATALNSLIYGNLDILPGQSAANGLGDLYVSNTIYVVSTTASTSVDSGSLQISGGAGISGEAYIGGIANLVNTTDSTSITTGGLVVSGGVGITKNLYTGGALFAQSTVASTSPLTGGVVVSGGLGVSGDTFTAGLLVSENTTESVSVATGAVVVSGGVGVSKNLFVEGSVNVLNTTQSTDTATGALIVSGGVGIAKNVNIGGNADITGNVTVSGDLTVAGTTTTVNSEIVSFQDNILLVNNGPSGTADSGIVNKRYQFANDTSLGDVVTNDTAFETGTAQSGTSTTITLQSSANATNDYYAGWWVMITSGTGSSQVRRINTYVGSTKVATIYTSADQTTNNYTPTEGLDFSTAPDSTSIYELFPTQYIAQLWKENTNEWTVGYTPFPPAYQTTVSLFGKPTTSFGSVRIEDILYTDSIHEFTSNNGIDIGTSVNVSMAGDITGVQSINGAPVPIVTTVAIPDDDNSTTYAISGLDNYGTYLILVGANINTGAFASFLVSASNGSAGSVMRVSSSRGTNGESVDLTWNANTAPALKHRTRDPAGTGTPLTYNINVIRWF